MQTPPTSVIKIAMTIATIGRLTKNSDMRSGLLRTGRCVWSRGLSWRRRPLLRRYRRTLADFLPALNDHFVARFQSVGHFPLRIDLLAHFYWAKARFAVLIDNRDLIIALKLVDGFLRNDHRAFFHIGDKAHLSELSGPQNIARIWKGHLVSDGAGFYIEIAIQRIEFSFSRINLAVAENQLEVKALDVGLAFFLLRMT